MTSNEDRKQSRPGTVKANDVRVGMLLEIDGLKHQVHHISVHGQEYLSSPDQSPTLEEAMFSFSMCDENGNMCKRMYTCTVNLKLAYVEVFEPGVPKGFVSAKNFKKLYARQVVEDTSAEPNLHAVGTKWQVKKNSVSCSLGDVHTVYTNALVPAGYLMVNKEGAVVNRVSYEKFEEWYVPNGEFIWQYSTWRAKRDLSSMLQKVATGEVITVYAVAADQCSVRAMKADGAELGNYGWRSLYEDFEPVENSKRPPLNASVRDLLRQRGYVTLAVQELNDSVAKLSGDRLHHYQCPLGGHGTGMKHSTLVTPCWCGAVVEQSLDASVGNVLTEAIEGGMGTGYKGHAVGHGSAPVSNGVTGLREKS